MRGLEKINKEYLETLKARSKESRVYKPHQMTGLMLADLLEDPDHKSLYMRLAKIYDNEILLRIAKDLADRKNVQNRGAYFMKVLKSSGAKPKGP